MPRMPHLAPLAAGALVVVLVVLTLTRIIKSVVTGQAPVTLELRNTPGKTHTQPKVVQCGLLSTPFNRCKPGTQKTLIVGCGLRLSSAVHTRRLEMLMSLAK